MQLLTSYLSLFCYLLDFIGLFRLVYFIILFASYLLHKKLSKLFLLCIVSLCQLHYLFSILNLFMVPMFMIPSRVERWIMAGGEGVSNSERDGFPWGGSWPSRHHYPIKFVYSVALSIINENSSLTYLLNDSWCWLQMWQYQS